MWFHVKQHPFDPLGRDLESRLKLCTCSSFCFQTSLSDLHRHQGFGVKECQQVTRKVLRKRRHKKQHPNSSSQTVWMTEHYKLTLNVVCTVLWWGRIVHMHTRAKTSKVFKGSFIKPLSKWFQMYVRVSNTSLYIDWTCNRISYVMHTRFNYDMLFLHLSRTIVLYPMAWSMTPFFHPWGCRKDILQ